jgi:hypothetical protein
MVMEKRNAWTEADFRRILTKAGSAIECSWGVAGVRDRKTGEMQTVLVFNDDEGGKFAYAFAFTGREQVAMLCNDLMVCANRIHKGEFGKS